MENYKMILALVEMANKEVKTHNEEKKEYLYSGHKNKAKRAILMARELLLEESKKLG